jgi:hypothetical protein
MGTNSVAIEIDGAGDSPAPTAAVGKMPVSAGTSVYSKRVKQGAGKSAELTGLGSDQGNISDVHRVAKPRPRHGDTKSNKTDLVLKRLRLSKGVTVARLMEATGWQAHSVRGFLSAVVRKKLALTLVSEVGKDGMSTAEQNPATRRRKSRPVAPQAGNVGRA